MIIQWITWIVLAVAYAFGIVALLSELGSLRLPFLEGLSGPAQRAWRLSNLAVLGITLGLTLNFWVEAQQTGRFWNWQPYISWALITWLAMSGYRRSRFQLHWQRWQIGVLGVAGLAFLGIGVWTLALAILGRA
jgi:hypothetical protein